MGNGSSGGLCRRGSRTLRAGAGAGIAALGVAACGGAAGGRLARPDPARWLRVEPAAHRATLTIVIGYNAASSGYNLDGAVKGALLFTVPGRWTVRIRCVNRSSAGRFGCVVADSPGSVQKPLAVERSAHPRGGLAGGNAATFSFVAAREPALYRIGAVTGGREPSGMWVVLKVTRGGAPSARWLR
jgi:hypothetical protein